MIHTVKSLQKTQRRLDRRNAAQQRPPGAYRRNPRARLCWQSYIAVSVASRFRARNDLIFYERGEHLLYAGNSKLHAGSSMAG